MAFSAGQVLTADVMNAACPVGSDMTVVSTTAGTTTSTTYTSTLSGAGSVTLAFVTPASGKIWVTETASAKGGTTSIFPAITFAISGAAGTVAASDNNQAFQQAASAGGPESTLFRRVLVAGLTPGAAGTITMNYKTTGAGTVTYNNRQLAWEPVGS